MPNGSLNWANLLRFWTSTNTRQLTTSSSVHEGLPFRYAKQIRIKTFHVIIAVLYGAIVIGLLQRWWYTCLPVMKSLRESDCKIVLCKARCMRLCDCCACKTIHQAEIGWRGIGCFVYRLQMMATSVCISGRHIRWMKHGSEKDLLWSNWHRLRNDRKSWDAYWYALVSRLS